MTSSNQSPPVMPAIPSAEGIRLLGEFESIELEEQYRRQQLKHDTPQTRVLVVIVLIGTAVFTFSDYRLFGTSTQFWLLFAVRAVLMLVCIAALAVVSRVPTPRAFDRTLLVWSLVAAACVTYIDSTRPSNYSGLAVVTVL
jgi:hypothetical protein